MAISQLCRLSPGVHVHGLALASQEHVRLELPQLRTQKSPLDVPESEELQETAIDCRISHQLAFYPSTHPTSPMNNSSEV